MAAFGNNGDDLGLLGEERFKFWDKNTYGVVTADLTIKITDSM